MPERLHSNTGTKSRDIVADNFPLTVTEGLSQCSKERTTKDVHIKKKINNFLFVNNMI